MPQMGILDSNRCECSSSVLKKPPIGSGDTGLIQRAQRALSKLNGHISNADKWRKERRQLKFVVSRLKNEVAKLGGDVTEVMKPDPVVLDLRSEIDDLKNHNVALESRIALMKEALGVAERSVTCNKMKKLYAKLKELVEQCSQQESEIVTLRKRLREIEVAPRLVGDTRCKDLNKLRHKLRGLLREKEKNVGNDEVASSQHKAETAKTIDCGLNVCDCELKEVRELLEKLRCELAERNDSLRLLTEKNKVLEKQFNERSKDVMKGNAKLLRLQKVLREKDDLLDELKSRLRNSEEELMLSEQHMAGALAEATKKTDVLQISRAHLIKEIDALRADRRKLRKKVSDLQNSLLKPCTDVHCDRLNDLENGKKIKNHEIKELKITVADCDDKPLTLPEKGCATNGERGEQKVRNMQTDHICGTDETADLKCILVDEHAAFLEANTAIEESCNRLRIAEEQINSLASQLRTSKDTETNCNLTIISLQQEIVNAENEKLDADNQLKLAAVKIADLEAMLKDTEENLEQEKVKYSALEANLNTKLSAVAGQANFCESKFAALLRKLTDAERTALDLGDKLKAEQVEAASEITALKFELKQAEDYLKAEKTQSIALEAAVKQLSSGMRLLENQQQAMSRENCAMQCRLEDVGKELKRERELVAETQTRLSDAESRFKKEKARSVALETNVKDELGAVVDRAIDCKAKFVSLQGKLIDAERQISDLEKMLKAEQNQAAAEVSALEEKLRAAIVRLEAEEVESTAKELQMEDRLKEVLSRAESSEYNCLALREKLSHVENNLDIQQNNSAIEIAALKDKVRDAKENLEAEKTKYHVQEIQLNDGMRKSLDKEKACNIKCCLLQEKLANVLKQVFDLKSDLEAEKMQSAARSAVLETKLREGREDTEVDKAKSSILETRVEELLLKIEGLERDFKNAEEENSALRTELEAVERKLKTEQMKSRNLQDRVNEMGNHYDAARDEAKFARAALKELVAKGAGDGIKLMELEKQLQKAGNAVKNLEAQVKLKEVRKTFKAIQATEATADSGQAPEGTDQISKAIQAKKPQTKDFGQAPVKVDKPSKATETKHAGRTESSQTSSKIEITSKGTGEIQADSSGSTQTSNESKTSSGGNETDKPNISASSQTSEDEHHVFKTMQTEKMDTSESSQTPGDVTASRETEVTKLDRERSSQTSEELKRVSRGIVTENVGARDSGQVPEQIHSFTKTTETTKVDTIDSGHSPERDDKRSKVTQMNETHTSESGQIPDAVEQLSKGIEMKSEHESRSMQTVSDGNNHFKATQTKQDSMTQSDQTESDVEKLSKGIEMKEEQDTKFIQTLNNDETTSKATSAESASITQSSQTTGEVDKVSKGLEVSNEYGSKSIQTLNNNGSNTRAMQARRASTTQSSQTVEVHQASSMEDPQTLLRNKYSEREVVRRGKKRSHSSSIKDKNATMGMKTKGAHTTKSDEISAGAVAAIENDGAETADTMGFEQIPKEADEAASATGTKLNNGTKSSQTSKKTGKAKQATEPKEGNNSISSTLSKNCIMDVSEDVNEGLKQVTISESARLFNVDEWLQSLTLTELADLHDRICNATSVMIEQDFRGIQKFPRSSLLNHAPSTCPCFERVKNRGLNFESSANGDYHLRPELTEQLGVKIAALQREIRGKQEEAELKIEQLKRLVHQEKMRLFHLKNAMWTQEGHYLELEGQYSN